MILWAQTHSPGATAVGVEGKDGHIAQCITKRLQRGLRDESTVPK